MTAISFEEAAIRGDLHINRVRELADLGYFKTTQTPLNGFRVDQDSYDQYLANQKPIAQVQKEMIIKKKEVKSMEETVKLPNGGSMDKIERYKWTATGEKGIAEDIPKQLLRIDLAYQREPILSKVRDIQANLNWAAFGRLSVSKRSDGYYYVFDGGHRFYAIINRSDVKTVPCDVFIFDNIREEAAAFRSANINRKPVTTFQKFKAGLVAGDKDTIYIDIVLKKNNIRLVQAVEAPLSFKSIAACHKMVRESPEDFERAMCLIAELCSDYPIYEYIAGGIYYLTRNLKTSIEDPKLRKKILKIGPAALQRKAIESINYHQKSGQKIWAMGMLEAINKGRGDSASFKFRDGVAK